MSKDLKLMVGNYVQLPHFDNYIAQVRTIEIVGIYISIKGELQFLSHSEYIGVALTPEVLDKCPQFVKEIDESGTYYKMDADTFTLSSNWNTEEEIYVNFNECMTDFEYLHQLQQLVYLLTNTELIVNF